MPWKNQQHHSWRKERGRGDRGSFHSNASGEHISPTIRLDSHINSLTINGTTRLLTSRIVPASYFSGRNSKLVRTLQADHSRSTKHVLLIASTEARVGVSRLWLSKIRSSRLERYQVPIPGAQS